MKMRWSTLRCPKCQENYPLARLYARRFLHKCPACGKELAFSAASAARCGAIFGIAISVWIALAWVIPIALIPDFLVDQIPVGGFLYVLLYVLLINVAGVAGPLVVSRFGAFVTKEDALLPPSWIVKRDARR